MSKDIADKIFDLLVSPGLYILFAILCFLLVLLVLVAVFSIIALS